MAKNKLPKIVVTVGDRSSESDVYLLDDQGDTVPMELEDLKILLSKLSKDQLDYVTNLT